MRLTSTVASLLALALAACARTPYRCAPDSCDPSARAICTMESEPQCAVPSGTCMSGYQYSRSAAHPGACVDRSALGDASVIESGTDASGDSIDTPSDVPSDVPIDALDVRDTVNVPDVPPGVDVGDVFRDAGPCPAPRAIGPISGSQTTTNAPNLTVEIDPGAGAGTIDVEFSRNRLFTTIDQMVSVAATSPRTTIVAPVLPAGIHYWRARMNCTAHGAVSDTTVPWFVMAPYRASITGRPSRAWPGPMDTNGDGIVEWAIGAPGSTGQSIDVFSAPMSMGGGFTRTSYARVTDVEFGASLANAGDVNGDGYSDLVVGSCVPSELESGTLSCALTLWLMLGNPGGVVGSRFDAPMELPRPVDSMGNPVSGWYGGPIAGVGDVDGDGYGDVVAGSGVGGTAAGAVFLFRGSAMGLRSPPMRIDTPGATGFGRSVAGIGDYFATGRAAVLVGADGFAFAYGFDPDAGGGDPRPTMHMIAAPSAQMNFGAVVAAGGDRDGDGELEFLVSDPNRGAVQIYGRALTTPVATWMGIASDGWSLAAGDYDGDGRDDFAVGAPYTNVSTGRVYLVRGPGMATTDTFNDVGSDRVGYGWSIGFVGPTADGANCIVMGAPDIGSGAAGSTAGRAIYRCRRAGSSADASPILISPDASLSPGAAFGVAISH